MRSLFVLIVATFLVNVSPIRSVLAQEKSPRPKASVLKKSAIKSSKKLESYIACGCGCCGPIENISEKKCIYRSKGESLEKIMEDDFKSRTDPICASVGCAWGGVEYRYCD